MRHSSSLRDLLVLVLALVIMGWLWHFPAAYIVAGLVALLGLAHLPSRLRMVQAWKWLSSRIGKLLQTLLLAVIFYALLTPLGLWRRMMDRFKQIHTQTLPSTNWQMPESLGKDHFRSPG